MSINFERYVYLQFSHGFNLWRQDCLTRSEISIMRFVNDITERADWQTHVKNFSECRAWKKETFASYFSESNDIWDWCLFELQKKATEFTRSKQRSVFVLDSASRVCKSDRFKGSTMLARLSLDTQSLDLSPWMLPFVFDVSPLRTDGRPITLKNFLDSMTVGATCRRSVWDTDRLNNGNPLYYSSKEQWLATDVKFSSGNDTVTIISPINNLHPIKGKSIYKALEHVVSSLIDDWNQTLLYKTLARGTSRIIRRLYECSACSTDASDPCSCTVDFRAFSAWANDEQNNVVPNHCSETDWDPVRALDEHYANSRKIYDDISLREGFKDRGLQIYVEILTIRLDSDGSVSTDTVHLCWDLNGNRNERIVTTTVICLRRENIRPACGGISFRTEIKRNKLEEGPSRCRDLRPEVISGLSSAAYTPPVTAMFPESEPGERSASFQELGTVKLPEGRSVTYPNTLQHKFEAPKLEESSKPGCMRLLQVHLVDPHYVVCSTRFVPPQSLDWWKEATDYQAICLRNRVPNEISQRIVDFLLVPEIWLNRKRKKVRGLQNYWQTNSASVDGRQPCQPPIRYESALRREQDALQRHQRVMRAVNEPKTYDQPRAFTIWKRSIFNGSGLLIGNDPHDLVSSEAPEMEDYEANLTETDAADTMNIEEHDISDFDTPLTLVASSGSEGSTEGED
ncbi:hypothetical protein IF1G_11285 [Cordyceps javanica]|uniref:Uncharacterized protein n=1 Tax=Cordyceps javanica TaxID=43265 RepID=A0A545UKR9_9HYPO|nr:hypothetical protein IF1G_11285 [Cordyceps javanica]